MQDSISRVRISMTMAGLLLVVPLSVSAADLPVQCRSLPQDACAAEAACSWVEGYTRKDGREVKAYCRKATVRRSQQSSRVPAGHVPQG